MENVKIPSLCFFTKSTVDSELQRILQHKFCT